MNGACPQQLRGDMAAPAAAQVWQQWQELGSGEQGAPTDSASTAGSRRERGGGGGKH